MHRGTAVALVIVAACGGSGAGDDDDDPHPLPAPACAAAPGGGSSTVSEPNLVYTLADRYQEAWLASPAVADLDSDGTMEIIVPIPERKE